MKLSAREIAFRVNDQKLSASKFIKNTLDSIRKKNSFLNAFLYLDKNVQKRAEHLDLNRPLPLAGVPVAVKDNITVINMPCTCGSRFLENYIPPFSATAVELLENAGALIIGKTNLDEFAMGSSSEYSAFGKTINPHFPDRVPGGSSGGSASAIAAGLVPVALGSDSGGSIRQPASFCQIFALKPTWGAISRYGLVPLANSLDCIGIMTRYLDDLDLVFNVLNQHDDKDNTSTGKCSEFYEKMPEFVVPDGIESYLSESIRIAWTNFLDLCRKMISKYVL